MSLENWIAQQENAASNVVSAVLEHMQPGDKLIDVGANVGVVTAAALRARGIVWAFEPVTRYREICESRNPSAKVFPYALGSTLGTATIWCDSTNLGWNTMVESKAEPHMAPLQVEVRPLDSFETGCDVLKIDVEGYEAEVIAGAAQTIQRSHPAIIMELGWGVHHPDWQGQVDMMEWLFSIGYKTIPYMLEGTQDVVLTYA